MNIDKIGSGIDDNKEQVINVCIEIPAHSTPVKYEIDKDSGALHVDRFVATPMRYPVNYGFVPETLAEDGDPVDVLVVTPYPLIHGAVIRCRPVGMLAMEDESGKDTKILAVPVKKITPIYDHVAACQDFPEHLLAEIKHFFEHYKDLEAGKWVKVEQWHGVDKAWEDIRAAIERYSKN